MKFFVCRICLCAASLPATAWAQVSKADASGMFALGGQLTAWRVGARGTELGAMASVKVLATGARNTLSYYQTQSLALGGSEGGFQAEYENRVAYGLRVVRTNWGSFVARLGGDLDLVTTAHGSTGAVGPLADVGYQTVSRSGYVDLSWRTVATILPALFAEDGGHTWQWFSTGPRLGARLGPILLDGYVARTMEGNRMRTEFFMDLCSARSFVLCTQVHEYRYDGVSEHVTLLGFFVGLGGTSNSK